MAKQPKKKAVTPTFMDRREINLFISAVLFFTNFLLIYFVCQGAFPDITGLTRLVVVWVGAYAMTWGMSYATRGLARLALSLILIGVLYIVMMYRP